MEDNTRREKLIALGPEKLADALLELADWTDAAENMVLRMTSSQKEIAKRFKAQLAGLKRSRRFVDRQGATLLAEKLDALLSDLASCKPDAATGLNLLRGFLECDSSIFARCDDSSGRVGDVFRFDATSLFVEYAICFDDKDALAEMLLALVDGDEYGIRTALLGHASDFLDEKRMRWLIDRFWERSDQESDEYESRHWTLGIESLARQLKDAALFEKARIIAWPGLPDLAFLDIAAVYLEAGDPETALERASRIKELPGHRVDDLDQLLLSTYKELSDGDKMARVAWRIFRRSRSLHDLDSLLSVIGEENRRTVIDEETASILAAETFSYSDARFLVEVSGAEQAEAYLLLHRQSLDGDLYSYLKPMAESLEQEAPLGATIVYRALLDSILSRAISKYYNHGVRYLRKLDELEPRIEDWKGLPPHLKYRSELLAQHGRKSSFWSKYQGS